MKKKLLLIFLVLVAVFCTALGITACDLDFSGGGGGGGSSAETPSNGHKHTLVYMGAIAATCQKEGNITHWRCYECHKCFKDSEGKTEIPESSTILPISSHRLGNWIVDEEATCSQEGSRHRVCTFCHETIETGVIQKLPHTAVIYTGIPATCTQSGISDGAVCSVCNEVIKVQTFIEKLGHDYRGGICDRCGDIDFDNLSPENIFITNSNHITGLTDVGKTLTKLTVPATINGMSITVIDAYALNGSSCTTLNISAGITSISNRAFVNCATLSKIKLPDGLLSIGEYAFSGCVALTDVELPESINSMGKAIFNDCPNVSIKWYYNASISLRGASAAIEPSQITTIIIPDSLTKIPDYAFSGMSVTEVTLPANLTEIGRESFGSCKKLESIIIPKSVTRIGAGAFKDCVSLTRINFNAINCADFAETDHVFANVGTVGAGVTIRIGSAVRKIPDFMLYNGNDETAASGIKEISFTQNCACESIGSYAFAFCNEVTELHLPSGVKSMGYASLMHCNSLVTMTIPFTGDGTATSGYKSVFGYVFGCSGGLNANPPTGWTYQYYDPQYENFPFVYYAIPNSIKKINFMGKTLNANAFLNCSSLKEVTLTESLRQIGDEAFRGCSSLESVTLPGGITSIGKYMFGDCISLKSINIPDTVKIIGISAFSNCMDLMTVVIPDGVTSIWASAFSGCVSLMNLYVSRSVISIAEAAFSGCISLANITVEAGNLKYYSINNCIVETSTKTIIVGCKNSVIPIDGSIKGIASFAFCDCIGLTKLYIPQSVVTVASRAVFNCTSLVIYCQAPTVPAGWDSNWNPGSRPVIWSSPPV